MLNPIVWRLFTLLLWVSVAASLSACGEDGEEGPGPGPGGPGEVAASDAAQEAFGELDVAALTLGEVLERFDVDGDGVVDAQDVQALRSCVEAGESAEGLRCDVLPDGVVDAQDDYLLSFAVGETVGRPEATLAGVIEALEEVADGRADYDLVAAFHDYNEDGEVDAQDIRVLIGVLEEASSGGFDLDGDGALGFLDVRLLSEREAAGFGGGEVAQPDVNGVEGVGVLDLLLLAHAAIYTSEQTFGFLDVNLDGALDARDFCMVSDTPADAGFYRLLMPAEAAEAAFAADRPRFEMCRADGRAVARQVPRLDTEMVVALKPANLYLKAVESPPEGFEPVDAGGSPDRALFVVTTEPTDRPLQSLSMPWSQSLAEPGASRVEVGGEALPEGASLVLPDAIVALTAPDDRGLGRSGQSRAGQARTSYEVKLDERLFSPEQKVDAQEFQDKLNATIASYRALIDGCPCALDEATRLALVRNLVQASQSLDAILSVSVTVLETLNIEGARLARLAQITNAEAAAQFYLLADDIVAMEYIKTGLLVVEVLYDISTGGLGKALEGALGNLISELENDFVLPSPETGGGAAVQNIATSLQGGLSAGLVLDALQGVSARQAAQKAGQEVLSEAAFKTLFKEEFLKAARKKLGNGKELSAAAFETVIKELIKLLPVLYVNYVRAVAMSQDALAVEATQTYVASVLARGRQATVVRELTAARVILEDLKVDLLLRLDSQGCPVTFSATDACDFDLQAAIEAARAKLVMDIARTRTVLDDAVEQTAPDAIFQSTCVEGEVRRSLSEQNLEVAGIARELTQLARLKGSREALAALDLRLARASKKLTELRQAYSALGCAQLFALDVTPAQADAIRDAEVDRVKAFEDFESAVRDALTIYDACQRGAGGQRGACAADLEAARTAPWAAASRALSCLPAYVMQCCGDGRQQSFEQCDASDARSSMCDQGLSCNDRCVCSRPEDEPEIPDDFIIVGEGLGLGNADIFRGFTPLDIERIIHSSPLVPSKPVAGDHTTATGLYSGTVRLDAQGAAIFDARFPCGPGQEDQTLCPPDAGPTGAGLFHVVIVGFGGPVPTNDLPNIYQYGFVFDADATGPNNFPAPPGFENDFFQDTDLWFVVGVDQGPSLSITDARSGALSPAPINARVIIRGNAIALVVPAPAFEVEDPPFRVTAFRHTGDFGLEAPFNYDGSLHPAVEEGLRTFSGQIARPEPPEGGTGGDLDPLVCLMPPFPLTISDTAACVGDGIMEVLGDARVVATEPATVRVPAGQPLRFRLVGTGSCNFSIVTEARANDPNLEGGVFVSGIQLRPGQVSDDLTLPPEVVEAMSAENFVVTLWDDCENRFQSFGGLSFEIVR